jgi:hypothetical protein
MQQVAIFLVPRLMEDLLLAADPSDSCLKEKPESLVLKLRYVVNKDLSQGFEEGWRGLPLNPLCSHVQEKLDQLLHLIAVHILNTHPLNGEAGLHRCWLNRLMATSQSTDILEVSLEQRKITIADLT